MTDYSVMYESGLVKIIPAEGINLTENGDLILIDKDGHHTAIAAGKWIDAYPTQEARDD